MTVISRVNSNTTRSVITALPVETNTVFLLLQTLMEETERHSSKMSDRKANKKVTQVQDKVFSRIFAEGAKNLEHKIKRKESSSSKKHINFPAQLYCVLKNCLCPEDKTIFPLDSLSTWICMSQLPKQASTFCNMIADLQRKKSE